MTQVEVMLYIVDNPLEVVGNQGAGTSESLDLKSML